MQKVIVQIPREGRWKSWAKLLERVDRSKPNGFAFEGEFLRRGERAEVPVGSLILVYTEEGSRKNWYPVVHVLRAEADGSLTTLLEWVGEVRERSWALAVRDKVAELLAEAQGRQQDTPAIDLSQVPTDALIQELRRRGIQVNA